MALFSPGLILAQRYQLEMRIGSGGMSQVWRSNDPVLGRSVAIKALDGPAAADPLMRAAIQREARAAARISHPNVTQIFDYGEQVFGGDGHPATVTPYLVMELIDGENLGARLARGPLPAAQAVRICAEVASALAAAHRLGVVHRDVKPANVMLTTTGAKVVDFGIAAVAEAGGQQAGLRHAGTPDYVAPEVLRGELATPASDVYGLGVLLHVVLTGAPPADLGGAQATLAGAPGEVADLARRCLADSPATRPTSDEVATGLNRAAGRLLGPAGSLASLRPTGVASVPARPVAAHTMLDADVIDSAAGGRSTPASEAPAALVRRRRPISLILIAITAAVVGLVVIAAAVLAGQRGTPENVAGQQGSGSTARPTTTTPTTPPPTDPSTPGATLNAIGTLIAASLDQGQIDEKTATDLADDLRDLSEHIERGKGNVFKRIDDMRDGIAEKVDEGDMDQALAAQFDSLLDTLDSLAGSGGGDGHNGGDGDW